MNWTEIGIVWRKELLDILRDRRTIMAMIVVPLLVYPVLIIVISQLGIAQVEKLRASKAKITVLPPQAAPSLIEALSADSTFLLVETDRPEADLQDRELDAILQIPADFEERVARVDSVELTVRIDLSRDRGESMRSRISDFLQAWRTELVAARLHQEDLSPVFVTPFTYHIDNSAGDRKMGGSLIGRILPFLLVVMMISGAFYPAIDVTAGERERGTLETLLVVPARRLDIVMGKFLTVFVACIVTTMANLLSIAFTFYFLVGGANLGGESTANFAALLDWWALVLIFVIMIPLAIFMSALSMLVASFARSFKEAQNYLSPLMIICMAPAYLSFLPGVEVDHLWSLVPIANIVLLSRELLLGNYAWTYFALTMGTMTSLALWLLSRTVGFFGNEAMLGAADTGPRFSWRNMFTRDRSRPVGTLSSGLLVQVFLLVLIGFFYVGTPLQLQNLKLGLVLTQVLIIAGIPLLALRVMHIPVASTLGLDRIPSASVLFFTFLLAPAATLVAALVAMGQGLFLEVPDSYREMMEKLFRLEGGGGIFVAILVFAVTPALCEEILFRGFVLRGLARRMKPAQAILWTAVLFGAFHFDMYRILPTAVLGVILGLLVWLTGSLWPAILLHATNNSIAVLANDPRVVERIPWLAEGADIPWPVVGLVAAVGAIALIALVHRRDRRGFGVPDTEPEVIPPPEPWPDQEPSGS